MNSKYFSYIEPLSVTEREYNNIGINNIKSATKRYLNVVSKYGQIRSQRWSNAWSTRPKLLSVLPKSHLDGNIFRRRKRRMRIRPERLAISLYNIINIIDEGHIKSQWLRLINNFNKKRYQSIDRVFDIVSKIHFNNNKNKSDMTWIGCKYSPNII